MNALYLIKDYMLNYKQVLKWIFNCRESMMEGTEQNPMLDLFYGHFLSEGHNEGTEYFYIFCLCIYQIIMQLI